jgi:hypothetical protein
MREQMTVAYLVRGKPVCRDCLKPSDENNAEAPKPVRMEGQHFHPFSQRCDRCRKWVVRGIAPTELFLLDEDPDEFRWTHMQNLLARLDRNLAEDDEEAASSTRWEMCRNVLRAVIRGKLKDGRLVFPALDRALDLGIRIYT